jgi:TPR repeat protein
MKTELSSCCVRLSVLVCCVLALRISTAAAESYEDALAADARGDHVEAVRILRPLAEQGHVAAQVDLGIQYENGEGVDKNLEQAVKWYRLAADQGDARAEVNLGWMYSQGLGVQQEDREAAVWYRKAGEQGNVRAQHNLGVIYETGRGVPKDAQESLKWYRRAAQGGDVKAQNYVGAAYYNGHGVPKDFVRAHMWFTVAAGGADQETVQLAKKHRDIVASRMTAAQVERANQLARGCVQTKLQMCDQQK